MGQYTQWYHKSTPVHTWNAHNTKSFPVWDCPSYQVSSSPTLYLYEWHNVSTSNPMLAAIVTLIWQSLWPKCTFVSFVSILGFWGCVHIWGRYCYCSACSSKVRRCMGALDVNALRFIAAAASASRRFDTCGLRPLLLSQEFHFCVILLGALSRTLSPPFLRSSKSPEAGIIWVPISFHFNWANFYYYSPHWPYSNR